MIGKSDFTVYVSLSLSLSLSRPLAEIFRYFSIHFFIVRPSCLPIFLLFFGTCLGLCQCSNGHFILLFNSIFLFSSISPIYTAATVNRLCTHAKIIIVQHLPPARHALHFVSSRAPSLATHWCNIRANHPIFITTKNTSLTLATILHHCKIITNIVWKPLTPL